MNINENAIKIEDVACGTKEHGMEEMNYSKLIKETIEYNDSHFRELFGLYLYSSCMYTMDSFLSRDSPRIFKALTPLDTLILKKPAMHT